MLERKERKRERERERQRQRGIPLIYMDGDMVTDKNELNGFWEYLVTGSNQEWHNLNCPLMLGSYHIYN